ncbi:MAG: EF-hand domain-containing protein [Verrucomicrobiales bacterium]|nr:EF-hand domain-containing protein [Verrucomicrobiales bacterium]
MKPKLLKGLSVVLVTTALGGHPRQQDSNPLHTTEDSRATINSRENSAGAAFEKLDTNRDRFLTTAEFALTPDMDDTDNAAKAVAEIDTDNDGKLSRPEFEVALQKRHPQKIHPHLATLGASSPDNLSLAQVDSYLKVFARMDSDTDGNLSHHEYVIDGTYLNEHARNSIFRASDSDADGTVTRDEYIENRIITDQAKAIMARADTDADGTITRNEFLRHPDLTGKPGLHEIFTALDTNHDAKTTTPEYLRVWGHWARNPTSE